MTPPAWPVSGVSWSTADWTSVALPMSVDCSSGSELHLVNIGHAAGDEMSQNMLAALSRLAK
jgi:hypothetical protein